MQRLRGVAARLREEHDVGRGQPSRPLARALHCAEEAGKAFDQVCRPKAQLFGGPAVRAWRPPKREGPDAGRRALRGKARGARDRGQGAKGFAQAQLSGQSSVGLGPEGLPHRAGRGQLGGRPATKA